MKKAIITGRAVNFDGVWTLVTTDEKVNKKLADGSGIPCLVDEVINLCAPEVGNDSSYEGVTNEGDLVRITVEVLETSNADLRKWLEGGADVAIGGE